MSTLERTVNYDVIIPNWRSARTLHLEDTDQLEGSHMYADVVELQVN